MERHLMVLPEQIVTTIFLMIHLSPFVVEVVAEDGYISTNGMAEIGPLGMAVSPMADMAELQYGNGVQTTIVNIKLLTENSHGEAAVDGLPAGMEILMLQEAQVQLVEFIIA